MLKKKKEIAPDIYLHFSPMLTAKTDVSFPTIRAGDEKMRRQSRQKTLQNKAIGKKVSSLE